MSKWEVTLGNNGKNNKDLTFIDLLEVSFITMKVCGVIDWSWWLVLLPFIIEFTVSLIILLYLLNKNK